MLKLSGQIANRPMNPVAEDDQFLMRGLIGRDALYSQTYCDGRNLAEAYLQCIRIRKTCNTSAAKQ